MNTEKELPGSKNLIKMQCQLIRKFNPNAWMNMPKGFRKSRDGMARIFLHRIWVKPIDISTKERLAFVIRKHHGFGKFNVLFWSRYIRNKKFNDKFKCLVQREKECFYLKRCRRYKIHKKGESCKKNKRFFGNWSKRASLTLLPGDFMSEKDYKYEWDRRSDRMHYFWYWED